ncbi:serine protease [Orbilia ellipsospora]|uniref:Serine protease n=1 Tax=Orbilia ellipsospora TaxID=2528407 RepID=A0AAV9XAY0_9PEZI
MGGDNENYDDGDDDDDEATGSPSSEFFQEPEPMVIDDKISFSNSFGIRKRSLAAQVVSKKTKIKRAGTEGEVEITRNAWEGLPILSEPKDEMQLTRVKRIKNSYYHYRNPGKGVVIYAYETGCIVNHPEFEGTKFQDWISSGWFPGEEGADPWFEGPHGTTVVDKIAGKYGGIAQEAEIVVVSYIDGNQQVDYDTLLDALLKMYDHIRLHNNGRPCVINMATVLYTYETEDSDPDADIDRAMKKSYEDILGELLKLENVIIVTSAGNEDPVSWTTSDNLIRRSGT